MKTLIVGAQPQRQGLNAMTLIKKLAFGLWISASCMDSASAQILIPPSEAEAAHAPSSPAAAPSAAPRPRSEVVLPTVEMVVGESRVFPAPNIGRIAVGNGRIMSAAAVDDKEVIVFANAPGTSSLFVWNKQGRTQRMRIDIVASEQARQHREVVSFVERIPNARATVVGDKVIVEGDQLSDLDQERVGELTRRYEQVVNFTGRQGWERMVLMDVKLVEMPTTLLRNLGLRWSPTAEGGVNAGFAADITSSRAVQSRPGVSVLDVPFPTRSLSSYVGVNSLLTAQLQLLEQQGNAVMLAEPQLSTRSGSTATFLAGGEIPYQAVSKDGVASIVFRPYGVIVKITPRVDRLGNIRSSIELEVSSVDSSITSPVGPALRSRKTTTEFNLRAEETLALSGFLSREQATDIDKVPGLGDLPILGTLFRSKRFQRRETEMVVLVTPHLVSSETPALQETAARAQAAVASRFPAPPKLLVPLSPAALPSAAALPKVQATPATPATSPNLATGATLPSSAPPSSALPAHALGSPPATPASTPERWEATNSGFRRVVDAVANTPAALPPIVIPTPPSAPISEDTTAAVTPPVAVQALQVKAKSLLIRSAPSFKAPVVYRLRKGQIVKAEVSETSGVLSDWRRVSFGEVQGWSAAVHLMPVVADVAGAQ